MLYKIITMKNSGISKVALFVAIGGLLTACGGGDASDGDTSIVSYTVSANASGGGTLTPGSRSVQSGQTTTFTVSANSGYSIGTVTGCGGSLTGMTYTTGPVTAACTVNASFVVSLVAPQNLEVTAGDAEFSLNWDSVSAATSYNLYYDTEPNIDTVNYAANNTGMLVQNVSSPYTLSGLTNGTVYYVVVTSVVGSAESVAGNEVSSTPQFPVLTSIVLNDTGIDWCASSDLNHLDCPVTDFEGQDGEYGRDAQARAGQLQKVGGGAAGFDFTKIAANGSVLRIQNADWDDNGTETEGSKWSCVHDNVTGLIWEVKTFGGQRDRYNTYSWYDPDSTTNGGGTGVQNSGGGACFSNCDTYSYVQWVNSQGLCGANDWRMPSRSELLSIVHNGRLDPAIDTDYFPNTMLGNFWTSSPSDAYAAWVVNARTGGVGNMFKNERFNGYVRLVRAK